MKINKPNAGCHPQPLHDTARESALVDVHASYAAKMAGATDLPCHEALSACMDALWKATKTYDASRGEFLPYARTVMRRRLTDLRRKLHFSKQSQLIVFDSNTVDVVSDTFGCEYNGFPELYAALEQLPEKQEVHVRKVFLEGYTRLDVARERGVSRQASCAMLERGMENLRHTLNQNLINN